MSYRATYVQSGANTYGLWYPRTSTGPVALLLGDVPGDWYGPDASEQARALVAAGYWVLTVSTPNWGNQTDMDTIDDALEWLETNWSRDISSVVVVAHNAGAVSALNWSARNYERVASISLQSPIIDLEERFDRVPADQASMQAAHGGNPSLELPGTNGSYASTPDTAALDIVGDLDLRAEVALDDWTPGAAQRSIVSKYVTSGNQRSYRMRINTAGMVEIAWATLGVTGISRVSTVAPSVSDGGTLAVRATLDVDNGASGHTATFYTATIISEPSTTLLNGQ